MKQQLSHCSISIFDCCAVPFKGSFVSIVLLESLGLNRSFLDRSIFVWYGAIADAVSKEGLIATLFFATCNGTLHGIAALHW